MVSLSNSAMKKIRGSSLIEVIIAMVIISLVFVSSITIYLNVTRSAGTVLRTRAMIGLETMRAETLQEMAVKKYDTIIQNIRYSRTSERSGKEGLTVIFFEARTPQGMLLAQRKQYIYAP